MNPDLYQELVKQINNLQKQVDGLIKPEVGRWMDWTPVITQGVVVAANTVYADYIISNDGLVISRFYLSVTGAGTGGNVISISGQPTIMQPLNTGFLVLIGSGIVVDNSVAWYGGCSVVANTATDWRFVVPGNSNYAGAGPNFALANGDALIIDTVYRQA